MQTPGTVQVAIWKPSCFRDREVAVDLQPTRRVDLAAMSVIEHADIRELPPRKVPPLVALRLKYKEKYDVVAMFVYMAAVHAWGLGVYPLGRDYARLANAGADMPFLARELFAWEVKVFGNAVAGYHIVNLALLYACMVCVYGLVPLVVRGPLWLGVVAAVLFMAHPVHSEAVLNLSGVSDLIHCLFALISLLAYAVYAHKATLRRSAVAILWFALAVLPYAENAFLILILLLYEALITRPELRCFTRLMPFLVVGAAGLSLHADTLAGHTGGLARMYAPLYFLWYPVGFLPETARRFCEHPWTGWAAAAGTVLVLGLVYRKARRPAILFALVSIVAARLFQGDRPVDWVHMVGGGQLLFANALFTLGVAALFLRMMDHPKWRMTIVGSTTTLCIIFFALQIRSIRAWDHAGDVVREFQREVASTQQSSPNERIGICPNYQYYRGAPLCLSEAVAHDTPFSMAVPATTLLHLHYAPESRMQVTLEQWGEEQGIVAIEGVRPLEVASWPYTLSRLGGKQETAAAVSEITRMTQHGFAVRLRPKSDSLPSVVLPVSTRPESRQDSHDRARDEQPTAENEGLRNGP